VGGHHCQNLHRHVLRELPARRRRRACVFARSCEMPPPQLLFIFCGCLLPVSCFCKLTLECAVQNVYPDCKHGSRPAQHRNESCQRAPCRKCYHDAIMRVPLEVATGPTCTPQGRVCIYLFALKNNQCRRLGFSSPILTVNPPFFRFPPRYYLSTCDCVRD